MEHNGTVTISIFDYNELREKARSKNRVDINVYYMGVRMSDKDIYIDGLNEDELTHRLKESMLDIISDEWSQNIFEREVDRVLGVKVVSKSKHDEVLLELHKKHQEIGKLLGEIKQLEDESISSFVKRKLSKFKNKLK